MKKIPTLLLCCVSSLAFADSLAPVIDNSNYPTGAPTATRVAVSAPMNSTFELMTRLDEAQVEIQQLNGKIEEQTNLIAEMKKKQSTMYADFDDRLQQVETKLSGGRASTSVETPAPVAKEPEPVEAAAPPPKPVVSVVPTGAATPADEKKQQYLQAFEAFRNGQVVEAISQFNTLLSKDPTNLYANNAQFWLGKAYRVNKDVGSAKKAFNAVLEKYPNSQKVPETLLELGIIEMEAKNSAKAKEHFTRVMTDFPNSKPAQTAAKKLQQLNEMPN